MNMKRSSAPYMGMIHGVRWFLGLDNGAQRLLGSSIAMRIRWPGLSYPILRIQGNLYGKFSKIIWTMDLSISQQPSELLLFPDLSSF